MGLLAPTSEKTILEIDMASYGLKADMYDQGIGSDGVVILEKKIRAFIDYALDQVGLNRDEVVRGTSGDNSIIVLDDVLLMHSLAELIYRATSEFNKDKTLDLARMDFRMGAATGELVMEGREISGIVITRAVRLEAAGGVGQLVIDRRTYQKLPEELQKYYGAEELIRGKHGEKFKAHRCTFIASSEDAHSWFIPFRHVISWWHNR